MSHIVSLIIKLIVFVKLETIKTPRCNNDKNNSYHLPPVCKVSLSSRMKSRIEIRQMWKVFPSRILRERIDPFNQDLCDCVVAPFHNTTFKNSKRLSKHGTIETYKRRSSWIGCSPMWRLSCDTWKVGWKLEPCGSWS